MLKLLSPLRLVSSSLLLATLVLPPLVLPPAPVMAQRIRPEGVWKQIYQKLPDLPLENQYVSRETGKVDPENTLVGRLIRYHIYTKGRPPFYRLDWKITLADYLGVLTVLDDSDYPSRRSLNKNPAEADVAAVKRLTRSQRDALVQALVDAFTPQAARPPAPPKTPAPVPVAPSPQPAPAPEVKPIRGPGGADLLK